MAGPQGVSSQALWRRISESQKNRKRINKNFLHSEEKESVRSKSLHQLQIMREKKWMETEQEELNRGDIPQKEVKEETIEDDYCEMNLEQVRS